MNQTFKFVKNLDKILHSTATSQGQERFSGNICKLCCKSEFNGHRILYNSDFHLMSECLSLSAKISANNWPKPA